MSTESNETQSKFIVAAMHDATSAIRALDTKVAALFFALSLPIAKLAAIWSVCAALVTRTSGSLTFVAALLTLAFAVAWLGSFAFALRTLLHVDNPARFISGERPTGSYYSAHLFKFSTWGAIFPNGAESTAQFNTFFESLPTLDLAARRELAFELMKLVFIRTIKMKRAAATYACFYVWVTLGGILWAWFLASR